MRWTSAAVVREAHFVGSLLLVVLLVFFAATGFVAQHRDWFHPRVERDDLSDSVPLRGACDAVSLAALAGGDADAVEVRGDRLWIDADPVRRLACRRGEARAFTGTIGAWPGGAAVDGQAAVDALERGTRRRLEPTSTDPLLFRAETVWAHTTFEVDVARARVVTWTHRMPLAHSLVELHRGRGRTDVVVDVTAALALLVGVTGVLHGLRYPGRRRRLLLGLLVGSLLLGAVLLAG